MGKKNKNVWSKADEKDRSHLVPKAPRSNVIQVRMLECITSKGKAILLPVDDMISSSRYCQILQDSLLQIIDWYYPDGDFVFVQDNAPCHTSAETLEWLSERQIRVCQWPPQSLNMDIIENIWRIMKLELRKVADSKSSRHDVIQTLLQIWREISDERIFELYQPLPARMRAVLRSKGNMTRYQLI